MTTPPRPTHSESVLLVDDDPNLLTALRRSIGRSFIVVLAAAEALAGEIFRAAAGGEIRKTPVRKLIIGMVLHEDIRTKDGELLISAGHEVTDALLARIRNYALRGLTQDEVTVLVPKGPPDQAAHRAA